MICDNLEIYYLYFSHISLSLMNTPLNIMTYNCVCVYDTIYVKVLPEYIVRNHLYLAKIWVDIQSCYNSIFMIQFISFNISVTWLIQIRSIFGRTAISTCMFCMDDVHLKVHTYVNILTHVSILMTQYKLYLLQTVYTSTQQLYVWWHWMSDNTFASLLAVFVITCLCMTVRS